MTSDPDETSSLEQRLAEILLAYQQALDAGGVPDRAELLARHPDLAAGLADFFAAQDGVDPLLAPWRLNVPAGVGDRAFPRIPGYEVLGEIGRGGMGVVYQARHIDLNRVVALKLILAGAHADAGQRQRFLREAQTMARLHHPNVVQIHEVGSHDGHAFLALEYIDGPTLAAHCANTPQDPRWAAAVVEVLARAVHHAHEKGVVHRDLKPSNVLLAGGATPKVMDFGLARQVDAGKGPTQTGVVVGTPSYMAPEQALGRQEVGPAADVYALGAVLYELLTGRPPFLGATTYDTLQQVINQEPVPVRQLQPKVPRDLETVCLKCLQKEPHRRYASAEELAGRLQLFLEGRPIPDRPTGTAERLVRWSLRNKALAAALGTIAALLVLVALGSLLVAIEQAALADANYQARKAAEAAQKAAEAAQVDAEDKGKALLTTVADMQTGRGLLAAERGDAATALLWFANAATLTPHDPLRQRENRLRARNWMDQATVPVAALSLGARPRLLQVQPDGDLVLALSESGRCLVWDWRTDEVLPGVKELANVNAACWRPDGQQVAFGLTSGQVQVRAIPSGEVVHRLEHPGQVKALAFSPDGSSLAIASDVVRVWKLTPETALEHHWPHPKPVHSLIFDSKGGRLATACEDKHARVFAVGAGMQRTAPLFAPVTHDTHPWAEVGPPAFVDDDRGLITITDNEQGTLGWWDIETGQPTRLGTIQTGLSLLILVRASPDGQRFAVAGMHVVQVWVAADDPTPPWPIDHGTMVSDLCFSPDGSTLLTGCWGHTARLWSLVDGNPIGPPLPHTATVERCGLFGDGAHLVTGEPDGLLRVWKRPGAGQAMIRVNNWASPHTTRARLSPDGRLVTPGLWHETTNPSGARPIKRLEVLEARTGKTAGPGLPLHGDLVDSCVCADNRSVAVVSLQGKTGWLSVYDVPTGKVVVAPQLLPGSPWSVAARPNHPQVAVLCDGELLVFDNRDGTRLAGWKHDEGQTTFFSTRSMYTPDGSALVTILGGDDVVVVREADTGHLRFPPIRPVLKGGPCRSIAVSADSRLLATAVNGTNAVQVWDLATGRALSRPLLHPGDFLGVVSVAFSPDGRYVLSGGIDQGNCTKTGR